MRRMLRLKLTVFTIVSVSKDKIDAPLGFEDVVEGQRERSVICGHHHALLV